MKRAIGVLVGVAAWGCLAVLGGGGFASFFAEPARVLLMLVLAALTVASLFTDASLNSGVREDRNNRWVLAAFGINAILSGWLPAYTEHISFWTIDGDACRWTGALLFALGGV